MGDDIRSANSFTARSNALGLLVLRLFLGVFLLQWSVEKLILPSSAIRISQAFYNVALPGSMPYVLGLAKVGSHLWIATWPTLGGFAALFLMRNSDVYTIDEWLMRRRR